MTSSRQRIDRLLAGAIALLMGLLVVDVLWQVFTRFVLRSPSSYTEELARYLLIWVGLLGAAYVSGKRLHLAVDLLPAHLEGAAKKRLSALIEVFVMLFSILVLIIGGSRLVYVTLVLGQRSPALQIPLGVVYLVLPISGLLMVYYAVQVLRAKEPELGGGPHGVD